MFYSSCNPIEILNVTQVIEKSLGRVKKSKKNKYQSRVIDIDILYVGALVVQSQNLTIPHPLLYARGFVLVPLVELCPELIDPVKNESITQIFEQCNDENKVILYKI
jgi:2-amino-4-hydroxy-6-hydroxymethyldihydropteridine diphosphokinase